MSDDKGPYRTNAKPNEQPAAAPLVAGYEHKLDVFTGAEGHRAALQALMDERGAVGWELVSMQRIVGAVGYTATVELVWKRPRALGGCAVHYCGFSEMGAVVLARFKQGYDLVACCPRPELADSVMLVFRQVRV